MTPTERRRAAALQMAIDRDPKRSALAIVAEAAEYERFVRTGKPSADPEGSQEASR